MSGCLDEFLLNGERLPLDGATDRFDVQQVGEVSHQCDIVIVPFSSPPPGGADAGDPPWKLPVIIVGALVAVCLIVLLILLVMFCVRRRRTRDGKGESPTDRGFFTPVSMFGSLKRIFHDVPYAIAGIGGQSV